ncbi:MAG: C45 family autoproteolytic acyltransferase/hydrolase [Bacteroidales bacterium]|nr:C45 family autoproteolytic acyltransferase/hydrolase [Bacteroidales bacterium]
MKTLVRILMLTVLVVGISTGCKKETNNEPVDTFEGGKLFKSPSGSFYIAELHGTFHQMGRQYGLMLKQQLGQFYNEAVVDFLIGEKEIKYEDLVTSGRFYYEQFPQIFKEYLDGIAETSGLDVDQTYIMSSVFLMIHNTGCSSLSAWGDYTPDHTVVTGRNLDLASTNLSRFSKYFHVVVWNPTGYPASVANIDFIGSVFYQTAINNKGIFLELQNGQHSDTTSSEGRENTNHILLESLFRNTSGTGVDAWFNTTLPEVGLIMNASFPDHATIYEWATYRVVPRQAQGLIAATNDFVDPSWHNYPIIFYDSTNEGIGLTYTRRTNLMNHGELNKGNITPQKMMEIFDITIPDGGATFPEGGLVKTIYSVVAQPSELKIWLKVPGYSEWDEIDLKKYFVN